MKDYIHQGKKKISRGLMTCYEPNPIEEKQEGSHTMQIN